MEIERILQMNDTDENTVGMILSNRMSVMFEGEACVKVCDDELAADLVKWKNHKMVCIEVDGICHATGKECTAPNCKLSTEGNK